MILHVRVEAKLAKLVWVTIRHHHLRWELVITDLLWIRRSMTIDTMAFWRLSSCWLGLLLLLFVQNDIISDVLNKGIWVRNLVSKGRNLLHRDGLADRLLSLLLLVRGIVVDILVYWGICLVKRARNRLLTKDLTILLLNDWSEILFVSVHRRLLSFHLNSWKTRCLPLVMKVELVWCGWAHHKCFSMGLFHHQLLHSLFNDHLLFHLLGHHGVLLHLTVDFEWV